MSYHIAYCPRSPSGPVYVYSGLVLRRERRLCSCLLSPPDCCPFPGFLVFSLSRRLIYFLCCTVLYALVPCCAVISTGDRLEPGRRVRTIGGGRRSHRERVRELVSPALPCPTLPHPALPCPALRHPALPCLTLPCSALFCYTSVGERCGVVLLYRGTGGGFSFFFPSLWLVCSVSLAALSSVNITSKVSLLSVLRETRQHSLYSVPEHSVVLHGKVHNTNQVTWKTSGTKM